MDLQPEQQSLEDACSSSTFTRSQIAQPLLPRKVLLTVQQAEPVKGVLLRVTAKATAQQMGLPKFREDEADVEEGHQLHNSPPAIGPNWLPQPAAAGPLHLPVPASTR